MLNTNDKETENTRIENEAENSGTPLRQLAVYLGSDCVIVDMRMF